MDRLQVQRRPTLAADVRFLPMMAAAHFRASREAALAANKADQYSVALSLARQCLEASTLIEIGLLAPTDADRLLMDWSAAKLSQGQLRRYLEANSWSNYPDAPWGISWNRHMTSLAKALQPYAHCSHDLIQWTLAFKETPDPTTGVGVSAIGGGVTDADKAERLALLLAVFLWNLLVLLDQLDGLDAQAAAVLAQFSEDLKTSEWLDAGQEWDEQLVPHVWFRR